MDAFWAAPPISRTIAASAFVLSLAVYYSGTSIGYWTIFHTQFLLKLPPEIWRAVTCFLITGPKLGLILDPYFLFTYGSALERGSPRFTSPADFFTYILFVCTVILGLNIFFTGAMTMTSALSLAFAYTMSQDNRGGQTQFIVFTIPMIMLPYAIIILSLLMNGPQIAMVELTGLVVAHLHDFITRLWPTFGGGRNLLPTPMFIRRLFEGPGRNIQARTYGSAVTTGPSTGSSTGSSGGVLPESWRSRGAGHRLGGD
ncbi:Der1-like family-domain-containing protein [Xylogone sp. PMI_703]|nr:Der1-like family-domain-containing protein [Xylogone sp. PMI_703]